MPPRKKPDLRLLATLPDEQLIDMLAGMSNIRSVMEEYGEPETKYPTDPVDFMRDTLGYQVWPKLQEIVESIQTNHNTVVESGFGTGKCSRWDEPVFLADGSIPIARDLIGKHFKILGFDKDNWSMRPMDAWAEDNGEQQVYEVVLQSRPSVVRTGNHPLLTWNGWKQVNDLCPGDRIAIPLELPICCNGWSNSKIGWATIVGVRDAGIAQTVAISVPETGAYVTTVIDHNTTTSAALACFWLTTYDPAALITLAPTFNQVNGILWRYCRDVGRRAKLPGLIMETPNWKISEMRFGIGLSPRKATQEDMASMQGWHNPNTLVIMDEAAGLPKLIWDAVAGLAVSDNSRVLAVGNPIGRNGSFYDATRNPGWNHIRISCFDHPNITEGREVIPGAVSRHWIEERADEWATNCQANTPGSVHLWWCDRWVIPMPIFQAKVLGIPPEQADDQLISLAWIIDAENRELLDEGATVLGLDPARHGGDDSAMVARRGNKVLWVKRRKGQDTMAVAAWLVAEMRELDANIAYIDEIGIGAGCLDRAVAMGAPVMGVNFGRPAMARTKFMNLRAECWWNLRDMLREGIIQLPKDTMLEGDLIAPRYFYDSISRIYLEDKDDIRARIGRSPDSGDALALCFWGTKATSSSYDMSELQHELSGAAFSSRWLVSGKRRPGRWRIG